MEDNMKLGNGSVPLTNISHLGIAVKDAEKTAGFLSSIWNIGTPEVADYEAKPEELIVGNPFKVRLVFIKFGTHTIELLQPLDDKSIWSKFIKEKGEGIHHIAYGVSNYDEMVSKLQGQGHPLLVAAIFQGCRWCYFDTSPGGMVIEFREEYKRQ
jgi:methylmalonyl-CoA/ethylmalonyl-CoA epimerase